MFIFGKKKKRLMEIYEGTVDLYKHAEDHAKDLLDLLIEDCDEETRAMRREMYDDALKTLLLVCRIKSLEEYRLHIKKS